MGGRDSCVYAEIEWIIYIHIYIRVYKHLLINFTPHHKQQKYFLYRIFTYNYTREFTIFLVKFQWIVSGKKKLPQAVHIYFLRIYYTICYAPLKMCQDYTYNIDWVLEIFGIAFNLNHTSNARRYTFFVFTVMIICLYKHVNGTSHLWCYLVRNSNQYR